MQKNIIINNCKKLLEAYKKGELGYMKMPEDEHPIFQDNQDHLVYFTLPMSLNYQRDSYKLRESALKTYNDIETKQIFDLQFSANCNVDLLRTLLTRYKIALQPNKHIETWQTISKTIYKNRGTLSNLFEFVEYDFLKLKKLVQIDYKKGFPYISGPKIFNYWSVVIQSYGNIKLKNSEFINIAPDTHVIQCSVKLGIITESESKTLSREDISQKWNELLTGSGIYPHEMHSPLWFWSRNNFQYLLQ